MQQLPERRYRDMLDDATGVLTEQQRGGNTALRVGATYVQVYADVRTEVPEVSLTFSAPAILDGHNRDPLPLWLLPDVAEAVWMAVSRELTGMPSYNDLRLTRLDLARDFVDVDSIPRTLWTVSRLPVQRARIDNLARGANGSWQSLTRGTKGRWRVVSYDKREELLEKAARTRDEETAELLRAGAADCSGRQRWELQMRRAFLRDERVTSVHLDEGEMFAMSQRYFERTRFGDVIGGTQRLFNALDQLTPAQERGVMYVLVADLLGRRPRYSHNPADDYRLLARQLNVSAADLLPDGSEPRRLDFVTGTEMVGDEALRDVLHQVDAS
jgi:hypothetical protein